MKKYLGIILALMLALSLTLVPAAVSAEPGAPTIDGVVDSGEWDGAVSIPVADGMGTVSVIAGTDYLYVLFEVMDSTDARTDTTSPGLSDKFGVNINPTAGDGMPCGIIFQIAMNPACFSSTFSSGEIDGWKSYWSVAGTQLSELPTDLKSKTIYSGDNGVTEWKIPLGTIGLSAGDTLKLGGACDIENTSYKYPLTLEWGDVTTYVDILVPLPSATVGLSASSPGEIIGISVDPTGINFGSLTPGTTSVTKTVTVTNEGNVTVALSASLANISSPDVYTTGLAIDTGLVTAWGVAPDFVIREPGAFADPALILTMPTGAAPGIYAATLVFWAEAQ